MRRMTNPTASASPRRGLIFIAVIIIAALLFALDLRSRGLAWQFMWSQTGEESAPAQLRGMMEVAGNLIRAPLETDPLAPIRSQGGYPLRHQYLPRARSGGAQDRSHAADDPRCRFCLAAAGIPLGRP